MTSQTMEGERAPARGGNCCGRALEAPSSRSGPSVGGQRVRVHAASHDDDIVRRTLVRVIQAAELIRSVGRSAAAGIEGGGWLGVYGGSARGVTCSDSESGKDRESEDGFIGHSVLRRGEHTGIASRG